MKKEKDRPEVWKCLKRTKPRELLYRILLSAGRPLTAGELYDCMRKQDPEGRYAVSTVYRVLLAFEEKGMVIKSSLPEQDMCFYEWNRGDHRHYAVCLGCHRLIPLSGCPLGERYPEEKPEEGFYVTGHRIEIYGYCQKCGRHQESLH